MPYCTVITGETDLRVSGRARQRARINVCPARIYDPFTEYAVASQNTFTINVFEND